MDQGPLPTGPWTGYFAAFSALLLYFFAHMEKEVAVILDAPVSFFIAITVIGFILWGIFRARHGHQLDVIPVLHQRLAAKDEDIKRKDEENTRLAELLKEATEQKQEEIKNATLIINNHYHYSQ